MLRGECLRRSLKILYIYKYILYLLFLAVVNQQHLCVIVLIFQLD